MVVKRVNSGAEMTKFESVIYLLPTFCVTLGKPLNLSVLWSSRL